MIKIENFFYEVAATVQIQAKFQKYNVCGPKYGKYLFSGIKASKSDFILYKVVQLAPKTNKHLY